MAPAPRLLQHLPQLKLPSLVVAYAFDVMPPQTREFLSHFTTEECAPAAVTSSLARAAYPSAKHELESARVQSIKTVAALDTEARDQKTREALTQARKHHRVTDAVEVLGARVRELKLPQA